ncbi:uncharacterized protein LOC115664795 isoform X2 [Syzygium oleosum]|uniref:uncharacterized protein LOC115664795 isoform X2 n=1 Tax=Syzygium oleosum TaxID=219896 RepID=UPI0024BBDCAF|nr:uncharacterized protein LOC115664795 isoform X2 [Syzygium oleosum]
MATTQEKAAPCCVGRAKPPPPPPPPAAETVLGKADEEVLVHDWAVPAGNLAEDLTGKRAAPVGAAVLVRPVEPLPDSPAKAPANKVLVTIWHPR